ncbi:hypothetical protein [Bacillus sp. T33-2]|uniref:hypothetical protein n=1 Tax=Bacillus sp. T33-2 TaxID=2054168 RepID=UPI000C76F55C|nr:hypothetical protein [Bacillus sp. T33-2]PLR97544.1 hypothetical protein CVD19_08665 [Bacillus sp. T33-2]
MKKRFYILCLFISLVIVSYLESPYSVLNAKHSIFYNNPYEVELAKTVDSQTEDDTGSSIPSLEWKLEKEEESDDYIVQTYREYEVYKDSDGEIIKSTPTSNFEFLRYKK